MSFGVMLDLGLRNKESHGNQLAGRVFTGEKESLVSTRSHPSIFMLSHLRHSQIPLNTHICSNTLRYLSTQNTDMVTLHRWESILLAWRPLPEAWWADMTFPVMQQQTLTWPYPARNWEWTGLVVGRWWDEILLSWCGHWSYSHNHNCSHSHLT